MFERWITGLLKIHVSNLTEISPINCSIQSDTMIDRSINSNQIDIFRILSITVKNFIESITNYFRDSRRKNLEK